MRGVRVMTPASLGLGIGWRPELALFIDRRDDLGFVEVIAENVAASAAVPAPLERLRERGVRIVPHGVSLSLGSAEPLQRERVDALARLARRLDAPLVSEHIAFVRAGDREAGHLLPVPRTREQLDVLVEHTRALQAALPVPLALENVAALFEWPDAELDEATFLAELVDRTGVSLLLDLANVYANARNLGGDPVELLGKLPLDDVAYVHVAGGVEQEGLYHDTHSHPTPTGVLALVEELYARQVPGGVMLERDDHFPSDDELSRELDAVVEAAARGRRREAAAG